MFPSFLKSLAVVGVMTAAAIAQNSDYTPPIVQPLPAAPGQPGSGDTRVKPGETAVGQDYFQGKCNECELQQKSNCGSEKYFSLFGGLNLLQDVNGTNVTPPAPFTMDFDEGFVLGIARGRYLNQCTRVELEGVWRNNTDDTLVTGGVATPFAGRVNNYASMLNLYREFGQGSIRPYVGAGIGLAFVKGDFLINGVAAEVDDFEFAYQGIVGINFWQNQKREFFAEYRYFANTDSDLVNAGGVLISDDFSYRSHNFTFGVRFRF